MKAECKALDKKYSKFLAKEKYIEGQRSAAAAFERLTTKAPIVAEQVKTIYETIDHLEAARAALLTEMLNDFDLVADARLHSILMMRYVEGLRWREIANKMQYAEDYVMQLRTEALKKIVKAKSSK